MALKLSYFMAGAVMGVVLGSAIAISHADPAQAEVEVAAEQAGVSVVDLQGAVNSTGIDAFSYLRAVGELPPLPHDPPLRLVANPPPAPVSNARVECIIRVESQGNPNAHNRSGASGLGQFLPSTWLTTPQGRAGLSVYDPNANRAAIQYMLTAGRAREFDAVRFYGC